MAHSIQEAFGALSISDDLLTEQQKEQLDHNGYCVIAISSQEWKDRGIDLDQISRVINQLIIDEDWRGGWDHIKEKLEFGKHPEPGVQRLNNLLNKHVCFRNIHTIPEALAAAKHVIQDEFCISQLIMRMPLPGMGGQKLHIDWIPRKRKSEPFRSALVSLLLDDYTKENGTTRIVPGTHKLLGQPSDYGYADNPHPDEEYIEAPRGSLFIYNVYLWHAGGVCKNGKPRRHLNVNYRSRKIWQQINFKKELSPHFINQLSDAERYLLKVRKEDPNRNEWLFRHRNQWFIKKACHVLSNFG